MSEEIEIGANQVLFGKAMKVGTEFTSSLKVNSGCTCNQRTRAVAAAAVATEAHRRW